MDKTEIILLIIIAVIFIVAVFLFLVLVQSSKKLEELESENNQLKSLNSSLEVEHLKYQLHPHTLNNILARLKVAANSLSEGMNNVSEMLEYVLYKGKGNFVTIEDEINFIKNYVALNDLFSSEIDSMKIDDSEVDTTCKFYSSTCIPHLVTAYFIENSFKHGDVKHPDFLNIRLKLRNNQFEMKVVNKIVPSLNEIKPGLGLANMRKRMDLLVKDKYEVKFNCNHEEYHANLSIKF